MSSTLVMTLLVRDEIDIVRDNIEFHLEHGVDLVVATDNGSTDGTREVLCEYRERRVLHLFDESQQDFSQGKWVTRMALFAREELGAEWILNNDADELWVPVSGDLKTELRGARRDLVICRRRNMMCGHDTPASDWRQALAYRVRRPLPLPQLSDPFTARLAHPYLYYELPGKALCRSHGLETVDQGNHWARYPWEASASRSESIQIYHFPVRSREQFARKVEKGGAAYARNTELDENVGWHWRRWYGMLEGGDFESAYREALPSAEQIRRGLKTGELVEDRLELTAPSV